MVIQLQYNIFADLKLMLLTNFANVQFLPISTTWVHRVSILNLYFFTNICIYIQSVTYIFFNVFHLFTHMMINEFHKIYILYYFESVEHPVVYSMTSKPIYILYFWCKCSFIHLFWLKYFYGECVFSNIMFKLKGVGFFDRIQGVTKLVCFNVNRLFYSK